MQLFNNIQSEIIKLIDESTENLKIAVTWFTNHDIYDAIVRKLKDPKFSVQLIVLNDRINNKKEGINFQFLIDNNCNFYYSDVENMVHHKFCIIDNKIVITGSYNWTYYAENRNWENIVVLLDEEVVNGYLSEFDKIISSHTKVELVTNIQKSDISMNSLEYIQSDYTLQANREIEKGNDLVAARIYTELLRLNNKQTTILQTRNEIVKKYNNQTFEVCPFEIGLLYTNGYNMAIPAYVKLPFTIIKGGKTPVDNATALRVTIQKNDYIQKTIMQFSLDNIKPCPKNTEKIEHTLTLEKSGILTIICKELNGFNRTKTMTLDIKNWL
jgi:hypothetical protein